MTKYMWLGILLGFLIMAAFLAYIYMLDGQIGRPLLREIVRRQYNYAVTDDSGYFIYTKEMYEWAFGHEVELTPYPKRK